MTELKGAAWRQTIYYPYGFASTYGRGHSLNLSVKCPSYDADVADNVSNVDLSIVQNDEEDTLTFFAVKHGGSEYLDVSLVSQGFGKTTTIDHRVLTHVSLDPINSMASRSNATPALGKRGQDHRRHCTIQFATALLSNNAVEATNWHQQVVIFARSPQKKFNSVRRCGLASSQKLLHNPMRKAFLNIFCLSLPRKIC